MFFSRRKFLKGAGALVSLLPFIGGRRAEAKKPLLLREIWVCHSAGLRFDSSGRLAVEEYRWSKVRMRDLRDGDLFVIKEVSRDGTHTQFLEYGPPAVHNNITRKSHYQTVAPAVLKAKGAPFQVELDEQYEKSWSIEADFYGYIHDSLICQTLPGAKLADHLC